MTNYDEEPIEYIEYAPNCYKIKCTFRYFAYKFNQSILNDGHYFIQLVRHKIDVPPFIKAMPTMRLVWANSIDQEEPEEIPLEGISFGKNSTLTISSLYEDILESFKTAKFWQIEITSTFSDLFVITAPKKPKIVLKD